MVAILGGDTLAAGAERRRQPDGGNAFRAGSVRDTESRSRWAR
jgi:hypothetical protein